MLNGNCQRCGEPIWWLKHERTGKPAPIDTVTSRIGNITVDLTRHTYTVVTTGPDLYLNHHATCAPGPKADRARALARRGGTDGESSAALRALQRLRGSC